MHTDDIVTGLTDAQVALLKSLILQIRTELLPFCVKKTPQERKALNVVDDGRMPFVDLVAEVSRDYGPELMMDSNMIARTARIHYDFKALYELKSDFESVFELLSDTTMQLGHNNYNNGLVVKDLVQVAIRRRVPGMETWWDKIMKLWDYVRKPKGDDDEESDDSLPNPGDLPVV